MIDVNRVLLLQAPVPGAHNRAVVKSSAIPHLGLGYLAAVLLRDDFEVRISDMDVEDLTPTRLAHLLADFRPAVVGVSTATLTYRNGLRVAKTVKEHSPESLLVMGGPHVSICATDALRHPFVDVVVRGEGEITFGEVCRAFRRQRRVPRGIDGTAGKPDGRVTTTRARARIRRLDDLPYPARHLLPLHGYNIPGTVCTSRGCPFACGFCAGPAVLGRQYTLRRPENVVAEVQTCVDLFGLTSFYFVDDTMTHDLGRLQDICSGLRGVRIPARLGKMFKWTCESRADAVRPAILEEMRAAGCTTIQFGMESGDQHLLDQLGKRITLNEIRQAVRWCRAADISPVLSMVFPHPAETPATMARTFDFIRELYDLGVEKIVPGLLTLFPGTRFWDQRRELGLQLLTDDTDEYNLGTPVLTTRHLTLHDIRNGYSQLLMLTQMLGGDQVGPMPMDDPRIFSDDQPVPPECRPTIREG